MSLFSGLGLGLAKVGAGVSQGELTGQQRRLSALQQQRMMDFRNAQLLAMMDFHNRGIQARYDISGNRIDEQQRQAHGREADALERLLINPDQQDNLNRMPGLRQNLLNELQAHRAVQSGEVDWRKVPHSQFVDPVTGEASVAPPNAQTPWQPGQGQTQSDNPYLGTKGRVAVSNAETGRENADTNSFFKRTVLPQHFQNQDAIAGTRENADLADREFGNALKLAQAKLQAGHLGFSEQEGIWKDLLDKAGQTLRAGGNPAAALKPLLFNRGMNGVQTPNVPAVQRYLQENGYSPDEINTLIGGANPAGGGAQFSGAAPASAQAGAGGTPGASGLTPGEQAALSSGTSGLQGPATAVKGSFQDMNGPPVLPPAGGAQAALPGGGPPTAAQVQSAGGGTGLQPFNPNAAGAPAAPGKPASPQTAAQSFGVKLPGMSGPVKSPYPPGSFEDEIFGSYTGRNGRSVPADAIIKQFGNSPRLQQAAAAVIDQANNQQRNGLFSGMPVQSTNGAEWPNVPDFYGGQVDIPGAHKFGNPGTTPVVVQGGFTGNYATTPPPTGPPVTAPIAAPPGADLPSGGGGSIGGPLPPDSSGGGGLVPQPMFDDKPPGVTGTAPPFPGGPLDKGPWNQGSTQPQPPSLTSGAPRTTDTSVQKTTVPSPNIYGGNTPAEIGTVNPGSGPTVSDQSMTSPKAAANVKSELKRYQTGPWGGPMKQWFQRNRITDPQQQRHLWNVAYQVVIPKMIQQGLSAPDIMNGLGSAMDQWPH